MSIKPTKYVIAGMSLKRCRWCFPLLSLLSIASFGCKENSGINLCTPREAVRPLEGEYISLAASIADRWISMNPSTQMVWNWGDSVLMLGIMRLYEYSVKYQYREYVENWINYHINEGYELNMSDKCPPGTLASELYQRTCDKKYKKVIDDIYFYLTKEAPKTPEGGISHLGTLAPDYPQLWIDSLFMFGMPMIRAGTITGDQKYFDLIIGQIKIFAELLQDPGTGLFRHAWREGKAVPTDPVFWARGNGWVLAALTELLSVLPENHQDRDALMVIYNPLIDAVKTWQDSASGLWFTVMNRPGETYTETSASALFVYSMLKGMNEGIIGQVFTAYAVNGIEGIRGRIIDSPNGPIVTGTSKGTNPGDFTYYNSIGIEDDINYGVGAVILALAEYQAYLQGGP